MYIKNIKPETMFVKMFQINEDEENYVVSDELFEGIRTVKVTSNIIKARFYTHKEALELTIAALTPYEKKEIQSNYAEGREDGYATLHRRLSKMFKAVSTESISYGYSDDCKAELKILETYGLKDLVFTPEPKVVIENIDEEEL